MNRLNAPRTVPYKFQVVEFDGIAWLFDNSTRTYICDRVPKILMEPLYATCPSEDQECPKCLAGTIGYENGEAVCRGECGSTWVEDISGLEPDYFGEFSIHGLTCYHVPLDDEYITPDIDEKEAWDDAREEAHANHLI
jgi:hypothetical protein